MSCSPPEKKYFSPRDFFAPSLQLYLVCLQARRLYWFLDKVEGEEEGTKININKTICHLEETKQHS